MSEPTIKPTAEQVACVQAFQTGDALVIEAGAGSGKTSTLRLLAKAQPGKRGMYIAYNKAIADDAKASFPVNVGCSTAHSLAYRAVGHRYRPRLNGPRLPARETARILGIHEPLHITKERILTPYQVARIAMETVAHFCHSGAPEITPSHVPTYPGVDEPGQVKAVRATVHPLARKAWDDLCSLNGTLKFTHDCYLKLWQLSGPRLPADFVLLDEAQDANPVVSAIIEGQRDTQTVLVGDRCQAIYGWRGAIDAMTQFVGTRLPLSQSFRFGQAVADEANRWLSILGSPLSLRGFDRIPSMVGELLTPDALLCRSNAEAISQVMTNLAADRRVALVGGGRDIRTLAEAAVTLKAGDGCSHPELFCFRTWGEVQDYVDHDQAGADLKVFVRLVDSRGPEAIIAAMERLSDERYADTIVSTAHKAKGREWSTVKIASDFPEPKSRDGDAVEIQRAEAMLAYVAVTRAKLVLDRTGLAWIDDFVAAGHRKQGAASSTNELSPAEGRDA
jgi:hypothetical protein